MGLRSWAKGLIAKKAAQEGAKEAKKWTDREALEAAQERTESGMDKMGPFLKGLAVAVAGGFATAMVDAFQNGGFELTKDGIYRGLMGALAAGLIAGGAYLKASPLKPAEKPEAPKG